MLFKTLFQSPQQERPKKTKRIEVCWGNPGTGRLTAAWPNDTSASWEGAMYKCSGKTLNVFLVAQILFKNSMTKEKQQIFLHDLNKKSDGLKKINWNLPSVLQ